MLNNQVSSSYSQEDVSNFIKPLQNAQIRAVHDLFSVQKWSAVNGIVFHDWRIITWGMNYVLHEPITCSVRIDIFSKEHAAAQAGMSILG